MCDGYRLHWRQPKTSSICILRREKRSDESRPYKPTKTPCIEDVVEIVRKQIDEDNLQSRDGLGSSILRISDSPLSEEIMSHQFPKKFVIPNFDYYTKVTDLVQHLRA